MCACLNLEMEVRRVFIKDLRSECVSPPRGMSSRDKEQTRSDDDRGMSREVYRTRGFVYGYGCMAVVRLAYNK